ncbi:MAG: hypothetical protein ACM3SP_15100 [Chloroflexota bacterium]
MLSGKPSNATAVTASPRTAIGLANRDTAWTMIAVITASMNSLFTSAATRASAQKRLNILSKRRNSG